MGTTHIAWQYSQGKEDSKSWQITHQQFLSTLDGRKKEYGNI
jgi:hypothetical protein